MIVHFKNLRDIEEFCYTIADPTMFTSNKHMDSYITIHASRFLDSLKMLRKGVTTPIVNVIDIGCRPYLLSVLIKKEFGWNIIGVNNGSDEVFRGIKTIGLDITKTKLPLEDEQFDLVIFSEVLEHLLDPAPAMTEIHRVLKLRGYLFLSTPNATKLGRALKILRGRPIFDKFSTDSPYARHNREYTMEETQSLLSSYGFIPKIAQYAQYKPKYAHPIKKMTTNTITTLIVKLVPHLSARIDVLAVKTDNIHITHPLSIYTRPEVEYTS